MYFNKPVMIPKAAGKIALAKRGETTYVLYEIGRKYDPNKKYNVPERIGIGVQIPGQPELMLPNENYLTYFPKEEARMTEEEKKTLENYDEEREQQFMLRDFFDQLFFEFQIMSRKRPGFIVNENKVQRINKVLEPIMEMLKNEAYAGFLELIPEPEIQEDEDGSCVLTGLSYSDVSLLLTQFKGALNRYFQKKI
jgi:hypothetical protein